MKIGIMGTRGVPSNYGGFETFAEELGQRLASRGHEVTVYCRRRFFKKDTLEANYKGIHRIVLPAPHHKYLETPVHTFFSFCHLFAHPLDAVILCNAANSPVAWLGRLARVPLLINVDGIERKRKKWNFLGRLWYRLGEKCSVLFADRVIADADVIAEYYREHFNCESTVIRYGADVPENKPEYLKVLEKYNLTPQNYFLYVGRLEPENNALGVIEAYNSVETDKPLVVVGDAPYAAEYIKQLKETADSRVIFTGYQFGEAYKALGLNCYAYIQASEVGGTHPALVESMARGNCILANDVPEHREVLEEAGLYYKFNDFNELALMLKNLNDMPEKVAKYRKLAKERAVTLFSWESVTDQYEKLCQEMAKNSVKQHFI